jgi:group II intron reverse transcriptase/maturase
MTDQTAKKRENKVLRRNEYYAIQDVFDGLYAKSKQGAIFSDLMSLIASPQNIALAYRRIKRNKGSRTLGTNMGTIEQIAEQGNDVLVAYVQHRLANYKPHPVRRVMIPKDNGKERPLGIPTIQDRLIQQCILQVMEPICEAKFHKHSYGFRPNRNTHHAISRFRFLAFTVKLEYVVDIDIKGFFDNVDHAKLLKQIWSLGIHDKKLICVISKLLKAPIQGEGIPSKGTPQGGILSPLLSNIVLNELDWWISNQWEAFPSEFPYRWDGDKFHALKKTKLKEMYLVRYADDFKIFCRNRKDAERVKLAVEMWLKERLHLETSPEKSKITNLCRHYSEFLGFKLKLEERPKQNVIISHMADKSKKKVLVKLRKAIRNAQGNEEKARILNMTIRGIHNYYCVATRVSNDFWEIYYLLLPTLKHMTRSNGKTGPPQSEFQKRKYASYHGKRFTVGSVVIDPIFAVSFVIPYGFKQNTCNYTEEGRQLIHQKLTHLDVIFRYLAEHPLKHESIELNDNRISRMSAQKGKCAITKKQLTVYDMRVHKIYPKGGDGYRNIDIVSTDAYKLIHTKAVERARELIVKLTNEGLWNENALKKTNNYRILVGNTIIE